MVYHVPATQRGGRESIFGIAHVDGDALVEDQCQSTAYSQNRQIQDDLNLGGGNQQQNDGDHIDDKGGSAQSHQQAVGNMEAGFVPQFGQLLRQLHGSVDYDRGTDLSHDNGAVGNGGQIQADDDWDDTDQIEHQQDPVGSAPLLVGSS